MKSVRTLILVASLVLTESIACGATGIYQTEYRHSFEGVACAPRLAFVVRDDGCAVASSLMRAPKAVTLSARVSQDRTGEKSVPGMAVSTDVQAKAEIPKNPVDREKSDPSPPTRQAMTPKRTSVLFPLDSFALQPSEEGKLSSFVSEVKDRKDPSVSVEGYTCDLGSQAHNDALARKRAEAVAAYLEKAGVHPARVTGAGKCCYTTEDPSRRSFNRRVEITVGTGENR
ncbi:MAG: OmpA family protein [Syntrophorhabdales bacterium]